MSESGRPARLITKLTREHDRAAFDCGVPALNEFLQRYALQNDRIDTSRTYVLTFDGSDRTIVGYYSLTPTEMNADELPRELVKRAGRFPIPGFRLVRLAVDVRWMRKGYGGKLLFDAGVRAFKVSMEAAGQLLFIDAKDEDAATWYERFGIRRFPSDPLKLAIPLRSFMSLYLQMVEPAQKTGTENP